jgi:hypothetical protein
MKLTLNERRILNAMEIGKPYTHASFVRKGWKKGIKTKSMQRLQKLGYITPEALPEDGHEHDWRTTGRYTLIFWKIKNPESTRRNELDLDEILKEMMDAHQADQLGDPQTFEDHIETLRDWWKAYKAGDAA